MIEYEVTIQIETDVLDQYLKWLKEHINEMLKVKGISDAKIFNVEVLEQKVICIRYLFDSKVSLDNYLLNIAPSMRSKVSENLKGKYKISRRVLIEGDI
ncbi:DUF4286 family protein [Halobacteriovorax sp. HLS]|uniref:DUF4286 family protein n=1 Tax=Halobacteriovorax sp. HLS TaxID=2234000 RepID=UPI000FDBA521|nr:DUF4286 family protein [Halobacteriovorax sp. HLS]